MRFYYFSVLYSIVYICNTIYDVLYNPHYKSPSFQTGLSFTLFQLFYIYIL
nr:MAG TPA: hypothetical protein [Caudoviricetes sp.]